jgi:hypothetical protein
MYWQIWMAQIDGFIYLGLMGDSLHWPGSMQKYAVIIWQSLRMLLSKDMAVNDINIA